MLQQRWIVKDLIKLLSVIHQPQEEIHLGKVILLAGLSHPMCDMDYFMSRLARNLVSNGFRVAQVDLRGHGDSPQHFSEVNLESLRKDISMIINYFHNQYSENLYVVGRGLTATLLAEMAEVELVAGVAGIAPYCIHPKYLESKRELVVSPEFDTIELFPGDDYVQFSDFDSIDHGILNALGAMSYNFHGLEMSASLVDQLADFDSLTTLKTRSKEDCIWVFADPEDHKKVKTMNFDDASEYLDPQFYIKGGLTRNPKFQNRMIAQVSEWITNKSLLN